MPSIKCRKSGLYNEKFKKLSNYIEFVLVATLKFDFRREEDVIIFSAPKNPCFVTTHLFVPGNSYMRVTAYYYTVSTWYHEAWYFKKKRTITTILQNLKISIQSCLKNNNSLREFQRRLKLQRGKNKKKEKKRK